ncbi:phosphoadenosine phosphosulfate reductase family protein [Polaromonas jejuensis]|uniref:Phosphoadenosine phosphosulfate reductase family protein n=1 Tax=Polaromonas jejuensis TaxID=457502 RepID=A0ABW0QKC7_9BURK|nr:phosphoadenosine phosphosulfate reductase family protein [Polaromonas jejuensis]
MTVKHVVSVSGGKDSLATLLIAIMRFGVANIIAIFCDTGNEHELTYEYLGYLERRLGLKITRLRASFIDEIAGKRKFVANDQRTRRQYDTKPVFEADGVTPVPKRDGRGAVVLDKKGRTVQKTVKVGGGRKVRWTNKAKRRALSVLHPTGNVFLDLCLWKGRFPSRKAQFCTEELKRNMAVEFQMELMDQGHTVVSWQGVRRDESFNRRDAKSFERVAPRLYIYRPIVDWTAMQAIEFATLHEILANPLYSMGFGRVGCFCINQSKEELRQWAARFPAHIGRIGDWEVRVGMASKRGFSTFFADAPADIAKVSDRRIIFNELNVWTRIQWAKTTRGGKQYSLLNDAEETNACSSSYALCE